MPRSEADLRDQAAVNAWLAANHVGAVSSPLQIGKLLMEFHPTAFQAAIRILSEHAIGASSTYHSVISVRSFTSLSRWDRLSRVG